MTPDPAPAPWRRPFYAAGLLVVLVVAAWEAGLAIYAPAHVPTDADYRAAAQAVRAGFAPGDLIVFAPPWIDPIGRRELGDLMPAAMVGRPDAAGYGRIWEVSIRGARAPETAGLQPEWSAQPGRVRVARYVQRPVTVTYDLVAEFLSARVGQGEVLCPWSGPAPSPRPPRGEAGAFRCPGSRPEAKIERRVMEIDYRPRYGIVVPAEPGRRTALEWDVPQAAWQGARLVLYMGLHDYYARKTESGPVDVVVALLDQGRVVQRALMTVAPSGWQRFEVRPPPAPVGGLAVRIEVSARDARARNLGLAAEVRR